MKQLVTVLIISIFFASRIYGNENLIIIRNLFYCATKSSDSATVLVARLQYINLGSRPELIGYKAMSSFMICYHSYNPYTKYKNFLGGKSLLEQAIKKDPDNVELRFLRLTVQLNVPSFLGYSSNINEDKLAIFNGIKNVRDKDLFNRIYNYTINAKKLSVDEKQKMKDALNQNKFINQT